MARITPESRIWLHRGVITSRHIVFSSAVKRDEYFASKRVNIGGTNRFTVVRDGSVRIEAGLEVVDECDYISFQNQPFDSRVYYGIITSRRYINNETTQITYSVDNFYTYMFDVDFSHCLIDRETISKENMDKAEDNPYRNDVYELQTPEPLPAGKDTEPYTYDIGTYNPQSPSYNRDAFYMLRGFSQTLNGAGIDNIVPVLLVSPLSKDADHQELTTWYDETVKEYKDGASTGFIAGFSSSLVKYDDSGHAESIGYVTPGHFYFNHYGINGTPINTAYSNNCDIFINFAPSLVDKLTKYNASSAIVAAYSIPALFLLMLTKWDSSDILGDFKPSLDLAQHDPKLARSPYSYARVISPAGDIKEYYYEKFANLI